MKLNANTRVRLGKREITASSAPYCIAEVGINHNGCIVRAKKMVEVAKKSGADAVKFQTFKAEEFCGDPIQPYTYISKGVKVTEPMLTMFKRNEFSREQWHEIAQYCNEIDITFLSTPQNYSDLEILLEIGIQAIKIGSDDLTNTPLLDAYSKIGLPLILSCGMGDIADVHNALDVVGWYEGNTQIALLLCTSQYPTPPSDVNISKLETLRNAFPGLLLGFSDHTQGSLAACMAVGFGARVFEKHFTLSHDLEGPDHWFSEEPDQLSYWVERINKAHEMLGTPYIRPTNAELAMRVLARRSIVAIKDIKLGEKFNNQNIGLRRPGNGLSPSFLSGVIGLYATNDIMKGSCIKLGDMKS